MAKKIWIFGDSFSYDHTHNPSGADLTKQWHRIISPELGMNVVNISQFGAGMDWIYYQFDRVSDSIKAGDIIIATVTLLDRRWLIKDIPSFSTVLSMDLEDSPDRVSLKVKKAYYQYYAFLDHGMQVPALFRNWLYNLDSKVRDRGARVLLIPCFDCVADLLDKESKHFPRLTTAQSGYLYNVSSKEHVPEFRKKFPRFDGRHNHLTPPNHRVLADKIVAWHKEDIPVDLSHGFHEDLIDGSDWGPSDLLMEKHVLVDFSSIT